MGTEIFCMFKRLPSRQKIPLQKFNVLNVVNEIMLPFVIFLYTNFTLVFTKQKIKNKIYRTVPSLLQSRTSREKVNIKR